MFEEERKNPLKKYLLFVCLGNICRSPAAEGVMKSIVADDPRLDGFVEIDSAGIGAWHTGQLARQQDEKMWRQPGYDFQQQGTTGEASGFRPLRLCLRYGS